MFCVIQEVKLKKPNTNGVYWEYEVQQIEFTFGGGTKTTYSYYPNHNSGRFERPHMENYKISIHQSSRENGKVMKKQCSIGSISYYELAENLWPLYDLINNGVQKASAMFEIDYDSIYQMVENKITLLQEKIQKEYHKTDEYKTEKIRQTLLSKYQKAKAGFAKKYHVDADEYDVCYNVFGEVMNQKYLDRIISNAQGYEYYRRYSGGASGNHGGSSGGQNSGCFKTISSTHTEDEAQMLKKFGSVKLK